MKLICEVTEDLETLIEEKEGSGKNYYIKGVFLQAEQKNRNGRIYPRITQNNPCSINASLVRFFRFSKDTFNSLDYFFPGVS